MLSGQNCHVFINNFAAEEFVPVEMANNICRFLGYFKEIFFFGYLAVLAMALDVFQWE